MADVGDTVERGAVIARLESPQLEAPWRSPRRRSSRLKRIWSRSTTPGLRITQMGATIFDVRSQFLTLWAPVLLYGTAAIYLESSRRLRLSSAHRP
jgi:hypothetical protein